MPTFTRVLERIYDWLISLRFAVGVMLGLLVSLIVATVLESLYDTPTAQFWVYRAPWFLGLLVLLGVNILAVALSRWPWKKHHFAFLLAHAGILMMLVGAWVTQRWGLDGSLRLVEGESSSIVEVNDPVLMWMDGAQVKSIPIRWQPPSVSFRPIRVPGLPIEVTEYLSHADPQVNFVAAEASSSEPAEYAIQLKLEGGAMRISQEFWLWSGDLSWAKIQAGPAQLKLKDPKFERSGALEDSSRPTFGALGRGPVFTIARSPDQKMLQWEAVSSDGKTRKSGSVPVAQLPAEPIQTGWKGNVTIRVSQYLPRAQSVTSYQASRIQYGQGAPPSAIRLKTLSGDASDVWLGLGDRALLQLDGKDIAIAYSPTRVRVPFALKLNRFEIERYEGTMSPKDYFSLVTVPGSTPSIENHKISMNEPLVHQGITFYQASYEDAQPRPTVSIFSVNQDPGRGLKYWGSILLVLGTVFLFAKKFTRKKTT